MIIKKDASGDYIIDLSELKAKYKELTSKPINPYIATPLAFITLIGWFVYYVFLWGNIYFSTANIILLTISIGIDYYNERHPSTHHILNMGKPARLFRRIALPILVLFIISNTITILLR